MMPPTDEPVLNVAMLEQLLTMPLYKLPTMPPVEMPLVLVTVTLLRTWQFRTHP